MSSTPTSQYRQGAWTVTRLKNELRNRNLSPGGTKTKLIERLERADSIGSATPLSKSGRKSDSPAVVRSVSRSPVRGRGSVDMERLTVVQLKDELKALGMSPVGNKAILVERLNEAQVTANPFMDSPIHRRSSPSPSRRKITTPTSQSNELRSSPTKKTTITKSISLLNAPVTTVGLFIRYCGGIVKSSLLNAKKSPLPRLNVLSIILLILGVSWIEGPHHAYWQPVKEELIWYGRWVILGILSSVGLGTGAHTFVLFLGPFIARVTSAAYICKTVDFTLTGKESLLCPIGDYSKLNVTIWMILNKVKWEAFAWGLGTAIGELPPFLIARASAIAGKSSGEIKEIKQIVNKARKNRTWLETCQLASYYVVSRLGFFGILLCASIPNPLFDLAGITCGYFMIPFMTFALATFLGKAVFKSAIQSAFVIFLFSRDNLEQAINFVKDRFPSIAQPLHHWLVTQRAAFQERRSMIIAESPSYLTLCWNGFLMLMILYSIISLINSAALVQAKREGLRL